MKRWFQTLLQETISTLADIKASDIMALYVGVYSVIFLAAVAVMAQKNRLAGVIFLLLIPIPILILTVVTNALVSKFTRALKSLNEQNHDRKDNKADTLRFHSHTHHAEFIIKDANAEDVAKYLFQELDDLPIWIDGDNFRLETKGGQYFNPQMHNVINHVFVARGRKEIYRSIKGTNQANVSTVNFSEMFFITVVQGGQNTTKVKFDSDDRDVFLSYCKIYLKRLQEVFLVTSTKGLPEEPAIIFSRLTYHHELYIENSTPEQVMNYLKDSVSSTFWYLHIDNEIAYDISSTRTRFYYPQKNHAIVHGIVFYGSKYDLEQRDGRILNRKNEEKISEMLFTVSISSAGIGDKTKLLVKFDTQLQKIVGFFDFMKRELKKIFDVKEIGPDWWIS
jgi:hypothetical protein